MTFEQVMWLHTVGLSKKLKKIFQIFSIKWVFFLISINELNSNRVPFFAPKIIFHLKLIDDYR